MGPKKPVGKNQKKKKDEDKARKLQAMIKGDPDLGWRERYNARGTEEWARHEPGAPSEEALASARRIASMELIEDA